MPMLSMGQNNSVSVKTRRRSLRSPFIAKRNHKVSLSHTFNVSHDEQKVDQLNINLATEEELMTLSGITREIAKSVVRHRQAIGRFRKVEDLALVGGIGADKLDQIRGEICVKNNSCNSSRAQSFDSLKSTNEAKVSCSRPVDINKANVFDLQCINGMSQEMAANIVHHRTKKGSFKKVDDLLKVKGINMLRFSNMCHYMTIDSDDNSNLSRAASASEVLSNGFTNNNNNINNVTSIPNGTPGTPIRHRKTSSAPVKLHVANGLPSPSSLGDIFELLSAYSYRPILEEDFKYNRNNKDAIRIATWNLHEFTCEKAQNLGVREVVCRTILENRWSIICVQDIFEKEALQLICNELNSPRLRKVSEFGGNSHEWHFKALDPHLAFIYDSYSGGIGVNLVTVLKQIENEVYKAALADFKVADMSLQILNIDFSHPIKFDALDGELRELTAQHANLIVTGDFAHISGENNDKLSAMDAVLPLHTNTGYQNIECSHSDNMIITKNVKNLLTGSWSIVRQGLTHLAIPNGWSWGGPVSPHCPLWTELYVRNSCSLVQNGF